MAYKRLQAPILSIHAPVQVPVREHSDARTSLGDDEWARSASSAVRFTIAAGNLTAAERNLAMSDLITYCEENGFGLRLLDPRPSHRVGNWFTILTVDRSRASTRAPPQFSVYPITFVGPPRVGSTAAITQCLNEFDDLSIASCSVSSLSDLAFITFGIGLSAEKHSKLVSDLNLWHKLRDLPQARAYDALAAVLRHLGYDSPISRRAETVMLDRAGDYAACHGPLIKLNFNASQASRAIWFSAEGRQTSGNLASLLSSLYQAVGDVLEPAERDLTAALPDGRPVRIPNLDYLIARATRSGNYRVKGKLSVADVVTEALLPSMSNDKRGTLICRHLEEEWAARLPGPWQFSISVAWRENWLGHWSGSVSPMEPVG
jgi:hypothetical protein